MATATIYSAHTGIPYIGDVADLLSDAFFKTSTQIALLNTDATLLIVTGTGFTYSGTGEVTGGTVNNISYQSPTQFDTYADYSGLSHSVVDLVSAIDATPLGSNPWDSAAGFLFSGNDTGTISAIGTDDIRMVLAGYGGNDTLNGGAGRDILSGGSGADTLYGNEGKDLLRGGGGADVLDGGADFDFADYSRSGVRLTVDLGNPANNTGEATGDTFISIEGIRGSDFNDSLRGDSNNNFLRGGLGADILNGRDGFDFADYRNASGGLTVDLSTPGNNTGEAAGDTFISIEGIRGGDFNDTLTGDTGNNLLRGGLGADALNGGNGFDFADYFNSSSGLTVNLNSPGTNTGEAAGDTFVSIEGIRGGDFDDMLTGNSGDNYLRGGLGADTLNGRQGVDIADYFNADGGLTVDLNAPGNNTGEATGDTYISIEGIRGGAFGDSLTGNLLSNFLDGGDGNDTINGGGGADTLNGGAGNDNLNGAGGADQLFGDAGNDTLIWNAADTLFDGGIGNADRLKVTVDLDLTAVANNKILNVEIINMTGGGNDVLTLGAQDVLDLSSSTDTLRVLGNVGDTVSAVGFLDDGVAGAYHQYHSGAANLLVDTDISVTI